MTGPDGLRGNESAELTPFEQVPGIAADARSYLDAAHKLNDGTIEGLLQFKQPMYFLFSQSIELMLKAYLASAGVPERERLALKHDLRKALDEAARHGFEWPIPGSMSSSRGSPLIIMAATGSGIAGQGSRISRRPNWRAMC